MNCKRRTNESILNFVSKFSGLAAEDLMFAGTTPASKVGEVLAITMLNNANLGEITNQSAKMQLLNAAEARRKYG